MKAKYKNGQSVLCNIYKGGENKGIKFTIIGQPHLENGEFVYYVIGDGTHYVKESKMKLYKKNKKAVASKKPITTPSGAGYALVKSKSHGIKSTASVVLNKWRWGKTSKKRK